MPQMDQFTLREGALSSLLVHALIFIFILLFPDIFKTPPHQFVIDPDDPVPVTFFEEADTDPGRQSALFADAGSVNSSDPRPDDAPPATNEDPFSIGNNPNRFVSPLIPAPPDPDPGPPSVPGHEMASVTAPPQESPGETLEDPDGETPEDVLGQEGHRFLQDPGRQHDPDQTGDGARGRGAQPRESLRAALGRLSTGLSKGGAPLRFDNPVGGLSTPRGGLSFDTKGFDWGAYARKIYWIIWTNWTQGWPPAARAGLRGMVTVRMRIWRDGRISDISVLSSSGTPAFDTCATVALEASSPLPALPADFPYESEGVSARFLYNMHAP